MRYPQLYAKIAAFLPTCDQERADRARMLEQMRLRGDLLTRGDPVMHFTASSWIVTPDRRRALLVWHELYRSWSWTGGHADGEEDLLAVAMREAAEETGLDALVPVQPEIFSLEILGVSGHMKRGAYVSSHLHLNATYLLEADPAASLCPAPGETKDVAWFGMDEILSLSSEPHMLPIYRKLIEKTRALFLRSGE